MMGLVRIFGGMNFLCKKGIKIHEVLILLIACTSVLIKNSTYISQVRDNLCSFFYIAYV